MLHSPFWFVAVVINVDAAVAVAADVVLGSRCSWLGWLLAVAVVVNLLLLPIIYLFIAAILFREM